VDANQFFSIANQSPSSWDALATVAPVVTLPPGNTDFADLFNGQMLAQVRQEFAAPVPMQVDLQLVSLGPKINLITADAPLPDIVSLASFARSQGLDEEAIRTLFGSPSLRNAETPTSLMGQISGQGSSEAALQLAGGLGLVPGSVISVPKAVPKTQLSSTTTAPGQTRADLEPIDWPVQSLTEGLSDPAFQLAGGLGLVPGSAISVPKAVPKTQLSSTTTAPGRIGADLEPMDWPVQSLSEGWSDSALQLAGGSGLVPSPTGAISAVQQRDKALTLSIATPPIAAGLHSVGTLVTSTGKVSEAQQLPVDPIKPAAPLIASLISIQLDTRSQTAHSLTNGPITELAPKSIDDAMQIAMRVQFDLKNQGITRRLAQMSGNSQKASWASVLTTASGAGLADAAPGKPWEAINIDIPSTLLSYSPDGSATLIADPNTGVTSVSSMGGESVRTATFDSLTASTPELSPNTLATQRSAQYQQLADRVGQALGQRLIAQMERGEWKLQLRLQPESLGRIDVALAMHAGTLDASFASDNSLTRDLIHQGAGKLRDTLAQSGTTVANVWVGGGQGSKHDGNPTPGRSFKEASVATRKNDDEAVLSVSSRRGTSNAFDGLDILA